MKKQLLKKLPVILLIITCKLSIGQISDSLVIQTQDVSFTQENGFDRVAVNVSGPKAFIQKHGLVGEPELPIIQKKFLVPINAESLSVQVISSATDTFAGTYYIYPEQPPVMGEDSVEWVGPDSSIYSSANPYPGKIAEIGSEESMLGYKVVTVNIYPLSYIPVAQQLILYTNVTFQLSYTQSQVDGRPERISKFRDGLVKSQIQEIVSNPDDIDLFLGGAKQVVVNDTTLLLAINPIPSPSGAVPDFVVITSQAYEQAFESFATWKTKLGIPTIIMTTEEISDKYTGVDLAEKIFYYLKDAYNNWGSLFVLLGGDVEGDGNVEIVPARYACYYRPSDFYYSDVHKNSYPNYNWNANGNTIYGEQSSNPALDDGLDLGEDHYVGRFPFDDIDELNILLDKTIAYEQANVPDKSYFNNLLFMNEFPMIANEFNDLATDIKANNQNLNIWQMYSDDASFPDYNYHWDELFNLQNTLDNLDHGGSMFGNPFHLVYHMDHSGPTTMGTSSMVYRDVMNRLHVDNLNNSPYYQIFYTDGCSANSFDYDDAISEHYILNPNGGAAAFIGSTTPSAEYDFIAFCEKLYNTEASSNIIKLHYSTSTAKINNALLGDPTLCIWRKPPTAFSVNITPSSLYTGPNNVDITINNLANGVDALICLYKEDEVYARETVTGTGSPVLITIPCKPNTTGNLSVSITATDYVPYETDIPVNLNPGPHLCLSSHSIDDDQTTPSNGNNNGLLDAGETVEMEITLANNGLTAANNVSATLSTASTYATISQNQSTYGNIGAQQTGVSAAKYVIEIANNTPDNELIRFELDIVDGSSNAYQDIFYIEARAAEPKLIYTLVSTSINSDNIIDPGDHVSLAFEFYNSGNGEAAGLNGQLTTTSQYVQNITVANQSFGNLQPFSTIANQSPFELDVTAGYSSGQPIDMDLVLTDSYGNQWSFPISLTMPPVTTIQGFTSAPDNIYVHWDPVSNIFGYNIYRSNSVNGPYVKINSQAVCGFSAFTDSPLASLTTYYYKVSCISNSGVEGPLSAPFEAWTTLPYHPDFPNTLINADIFGDRIESSPMVADINNDGYKEVFFTINDYSVKKGSIFGFKHDNVELFDIDNDPATTSGFYKFTDASSSATPALCDLDMDGNLEVITTTRGSNPPSGDEMKLFIHHTVDNDQNGTPDIYWTANIGDEDLKGAVLADLDNNGTMEIISKSSWETPIYVFNSDGSNYPGWPKSFTHNPGGRGMPVAVDLDNNGLKEIIFGFNNVVDPNNASNILFEGGIYVFKHNGDPFITGNTDGLFYKNGATGTNLDRMDSPVSVADVNGDGYKEIICVSGRKIPFSRAKARIFILDRYGNCLPNWGYDEHIIDMTYGGDLWLPATSVGDIDNDTYLEIVIADKDYIYAWNHDGTPLNSNFPINVPGLQCKLNNPLLADVDQDDDIEIIVASNGSTSNIYAYNTDGTSPEGWPLNLYGVFSTPCIDDIDNDGLNEIVATSSTKIYVWDTPGDAGKIEWGKYRYDQYNSGVYKNDPCIASATVTIYGNVTWTNKRVCGDVVIKNNASLTITGLVSLSDNKKIVVEPGGKLIVDGGHLTNEYGGFWSGIQVWGNLWLSQMDEANQGVVILKNGAIIENAVNAVQAIHDNGDGTLNWGRTGGIIQASNANFINNKRGIWIGGYHNFSPTRTDLRLNNRSYIKNCLFKIDDNYIFEGTGFHFFIGLCGVDGIRIYGNDFINSTPLIGNPTTSIDGFTQRGSGVVAYDASVNVKYSCPSSWHYPWLCPEYKKNHFEGLNYGIAVFNDNTGKPLSVDMCEFVNNYRGALLTGCSNTRVTGNEFLVPNMDTGYIPAGPYNNESDREPYGLYMNGSTRFYVQENNFQSLEGEAGKTESTNGLIVNNSFDNDNELYKNNFYNLQWGFTALNANRGQGSYDPGLKLFCNNFTDYEATNYNDIDVSFNLPGLPVIGIAKYQRGNIIVDGTPNYLPAENIFSHDCYKPDADFDNDHAWSLNYYHNTGNAGDHWIPECYSNILLVTTPNLPPEVEPCESKTEDFIRPLQEHYDNLAIAAQAEKSARIVLKIWENGGIPDLEEQVGLTEPWEAYEQFNNLMMESPYLDEGVLIEVIENPVFTSLMVKLLCVANPQASRSEPVIDALYNREPAMPESYIEEILAEEQTISQLELLQGDVAACHHLYKQIAGHIIVNYLNDTIDEGDYVLDSLVNFLSREKDLNSMYELASIYLDRGMYDNMTSLLESIPNEFEMSGEEWENYWVYMDFFNIMRTIKQSAEEGAPLPDSPPGEEPLTSPNPIDYLTPNDISWLENIASYARHYYAYWALGLLKQHDENYAYAEPIIHSDENQYKKPRRIRKVENQPALKVYPNPALDYVTLAYRTGELYQDVWVEMHDMTGRVLLNKKLQGGDNEELLDLRTIKPGIYLLKLMGDNKLIESQVISIVSR